MKKLSLIEKLKKCENRFPHFSNSANFIELVLIIGYFEDDHRPPCTLNLSPPNPQLVHSDHGTRAPQLSRHRRARRP